MSGPPLESGRNANRLELRTGLPLVVHILTLSLTAVSYAYWSGRELAGPTPWSLANRLAFTFPALVSLGMVLCRKGATLDRGSGDARIWWGLCLPFTRLSAIVYDSGKTRLESIEMVKFARYSRNLPSRFSSPQFNVKSGYAYPVSLVARDRTELVLWDCGDRFGARAASECLAKFLGVGVMDAISGTKPREAGTLDEPLGDRLRRQAGAGPQPEPETSPGRLLEAADAQGVVFSLPPRRWNWDGAAIVCNGLAFWAFTWWMFTRKMNVPGYSAAAVFGTTATVFYPVWWRMSSERIRLSSAELTVETVIAGCVRRKAMRLDRIEELEFEDFAIGYGQRQMGLKLVARGDDGAFAIGADLEFSELQWLRARILNLLKDN